MFLLDKYFQCKKSLLRLQIPDAPHISTPENAFNLGYDALNQKLFFNIAPPLGRHSDIWTRPAPLFPGAYLWDKNSNIKIIRN
jgi:hypothetical protein